LDDARSHALCSSSAADDGGGGSCVRRRLNTRSSAASSYSASPNSYGFARHERIDATGLPRGHREIDARFAFNRAWDAPFSTRGRVPCHSFSKFAM